VLLIGRLLVRYRP